MNTRAARAVKIKEEPLILEPRKNTKNTAGSALAPRKFIIGAKAIGSMRPTLSFGSNLNFLVIKTSAKVTTNDKTRKAKSGKRNFEVLLGWTSVLNAKKNLTSPAFQKSSNQSTIETTSEMKRNTT